MERIQRALELAHVRRAVDMEPPLAGHSSPEERAMLRSAAQAAEVVVPKLAVDRATLRARKIVFPEDSSSAARAYRMLRAQVLHRVRASGLGRDRHREQRERRG